MSEALTIAMARKVAEPIIYGLCDAGGIFYVGQTRSANRRFKEHAACASTNRHLNHRVRAAGDALRVVVLRRSPGDLNLAEREEILSRPGLVNIIGVDRPFDSFPRLTAHPDRPWIASPPLQTPSEWAKIRTGRDAELDALLSAMSPARRCAYELNLLASLHPYIQRRFSRWLAQTGPKMRAALEAA